MMEFDTTGWLIVIGCALSIGLSKTSGISFVLLFIPLTATIMPTRQSVGFVLPMLIIADAIAVIYWRRSVLPAHLLRLAPWALAGLTLGYLALDHLPDKHLMAIIGAIILAMSALTLQRTLRPQSPQPPHRHRWFTPTMGILAGLTSMIANAAGPVMTIYLLAMRLDKHHFIATAAWFFAAINLIKFPLNCLQFAITRQSLLTNLALAPGIGIGALLGAWLARRIPQRPFNIIVSVLAGIAAVTLCFKALP